MKKSSKPLIIGSVAFDILFNITTDFREAIPLKGGKIEHFNASYIANNPEKRFGGNGGNVGYWLSTLDTPFHLLSSFGADLHASGYYDRIIKGGGDLRGSEGDYTAIAYMISDPLGQQCIIWQPNGWEQLSVTSYRLSDFYSKEEIQSVDYALLSVLPPETALRFARELKALNPTLTLILDPGQVAPVYTPDLLYQCLQHTDILTGNDIEKVHFDRAYDVSGHTRPWERGEIALIETLGKDGCRLYEEGRETMFEAAACKKVVEPTGAGDAFRAGLISELINGKPLKEAIPLGLQLGARCVEMMGPQGD